MEHVKRMGTLVGVCVPFALNNWCREELLKKINEDENNMKIKIETVHQQEHSVKAMVDYATIDEDPEKFKS